MKKAFILNINSGTIHKKGCYLALRIKKGNEKYFESAQDAASFFETSSDKASFCAFCFRERTIGGR